ncbi:MAG: helix-turn-helix transcriptional regulator, partial [Proteiniphilum sp.]
MRIKELIRSKGYTQKEFANKLGITLSALNQRIDGNPSLNTLREIATALDVPLRDLFNGEDKYNVIACPNCGEKINITV